MKKSFNLAVLESRWWARGNISVKALFDALADLHVNNPSAYHYEMFNTDNSFRDALRRVGKDRNIRHVYLAAHADDAALYGAGDNRISRTVIGNTLDDLASNGGSKLDGVFFGCCNIRNQDTIEFILSPVKSDRIKVRWVAGYKKAVHWVAASAVDLWFWNKFYRLGGKKTELERIESLAKRIDKFMPGAHDELGFGIYVRRKGNGRGVRGLIAELRQQARP